MAFFLPRVPFLSWLQSNLPSLRRVEDLALPVLQNLSPAVHEGFQMWPIWKDCNEGFLMRLWLHANRRWVRTCETIVEQGTEGHELFFLIHGSCEVLLDGERVGELKAGSVFGELAVLGLKRVRAASLRTLQICELHTITRDTLMAALEQFPEESMIFVDLAKSYGVSSNAMAELASLDFFSGCTSPTLVQDLLQRPVSHYMPGQSIFSAGDEVESLFIVASGTFEEFLGNALLRRVEENFAIKMAEIIFN